ncbi:MAG: hypothetical protein RL137_305 [Bacteroidota bacterium]|jgi:hypothetical protein
MRNKKLLWVIGILFALLVVLYLINNSRFEMYENQKKNTEVEKVERVQISTDFNTNTFSSKDEPKILKELKLCDSSIQWSEDLNRPSCTPNYFRVFPLKKGLDISQGCMVLLKAGVNGFPVRRFVVYEKEGSQFVQANGFIGYPIEFRPQAKTYDDVVIRFFERYEEEKYFYNCLFTWKQNRYQFVRCEQINDANIKPEKQKEVSAQILQILNEKQLVF